MYMAPLTTLNQKTFDHSINYQIISIQELSLLPYSSDLIETLMEDTRSGLEAIVPGTLIPITIFEDILSLPVSNSFLIITLIALSINPTKFSPTMKLS